MGQVADGSGDIIVFLRFHNHRDGPQLFHEFREAVCLLLWDPRRGRQHIVGVSISMALELAYPLFSLPAMGCPPMKYPLRPSLWASRWMSDFTLPTSVRIQSLSR